MQAGDRKNYRTTAWPPSRCSCLGWVEVSRSHCLVHAPRQGIIIQQRILLWSGQHAGPLQGDADSDSGTQVNDWFTKDMEENWGYDPRSTPASEEPLLRGTQAVRPWQRCGKAERFMNLTNFNRLRGRGVSRSVRPYF